MEENDDSPPEGVLTQRALGWELIAQDLCNELVGTVVRLVEEKKDILMAEARSLESLRKAVEEECRVKIEQTEKVIKEKSQNSEKDLQHIEAQKERLQDEIAEISKTTTSWGKIIKLNVGTCPPFHRDSLTVNACRWQTFYIFCFHSDKVIDQITMTISSPHCV